MKSARGIGSYAYFTIFFGLDTLFKASVNPYRGTEQKREI